MTKLVTLIHFYQTVPEVGLESNQGLERYITALMPLPKVVSGIIGNNIEMPYGSPVAANTFTFHERTGKSISQEDNSLVPGELYVHNSLFPVMNSVPRIQLTVRYIIREKVGLQRKKSNWKDHPGTIFACVEIPVVLKTREEVVTQN